MNNSILGIDIGTHSIKAVELIRGKNKKIRLRSVGYIPSPSVSSEGTTKKIVEGLGRLIHDMKVSTNEAVISLPPSKVVTRIVEVPLMKDAELASSIQWEAEQYIPWPLAKSRVDYAVIEENPDTKRMKILLAAAPKDFVESIMSIVDQVGITPIGIEPEVVAIVRCITFSLPPLPAILVLSFGATNSEIALVRKKEIVFTKSFPIGGNTLGRAISEEMGFQFTQAEEYKKTYGIEENRLEGKIYKVIIPLLSAMLSDLEKALIYYKSQYSQETISTLVLTGGSAKIPGLVPYLTKYFGLDCQLINPFSSISVDSSIAPMVIPDGVLYTVATGLGLKVFDL
ncbi:hypothetical protein A3D77_02850 [Candidatus Gottesmanbacteria bacterium RIFCSPHIGHO2_02_FULL_39_11]|uniref:SHS2 domain-containing protein n=1 Tax=Candidatus Gottesmanbacteria bacterium RIFCSPHIGHO2_02_FULL_39_11 TaxID=1798382 RepID=A0A1F5ZT36_9BACT|nr:MAG: hypothetical protein A3D77_02850 [Candidatus Gottesmanbacteria bacterium RIFCSPHIGHO2_02_FULL_39_11]